jgi:hypothetical protein
MIDLEAGMDRLWRHIQWYSRHCRTPRNELLWRLNARLRGEDPGEPFHWPGL